MGCFKGKSLVLLLLLLTSALIITGCIEDEVSYTLTVRVDGNGSVSPNQGSHSYEEDTVVNLKATPAAGQSFAGWSGEVAGAGSAETTVVMDKDKTITAKFDKEYNIGDVGPAGGLIFYKDEDNAYWTYLEAWTQDELGTYQWKTENTETFYTGLEIGSGYSNTYTRMTIGSHPAAQAARNASHGGYTDWFLPSPAALDEMGDVLHAEGFGDFELDAYYWSSYNNDNEHAYAMVVWANYFVGYHRDKTDYNRVRVIRRF